MEVQPQLVLLQKTLLYVEGLGRQLYPQLDLWKTAKPFLEQWVKDQVGPMAVLKHIQANLPFWGEKLPELPDLIYNSLKNNQRPHAQITEHRPTAIKPLLLGLFGCTSFLAACLFYVEKQPILAAISLTCSIGFSLSAWLKTNN